MHELRTAVEVEAPIETAWTVLLDWPAYPLWNPFVRRIEGRAEVGATLDVTFAITRPLGGSKGATRSMRIRPLVVGLESPRHLSWQGQLLSAFVLQGEHRFELESLGPTRCRFHHDECLIGALAHPLEPWLQRAHRSTFEAMNTAFALRVARVSAGR